MRDTNKRKREEESYYLQTVTENSNFQGGTTVSIQNMQTPVIEQNPTYNQSLLLNQPIIQNQQLLYQLQRTTDAQQNLVYLIVPTNENIQVQSVPLTVVNDQQNTAQYVTSSQLTQDGNQTENTIILQDIKEEVTEVKTELFLEENINSNSEKNIEYSYNTPQSQSKNENSTCTANTGYNQVYIKTVSNPKDNSSKPHWYHCDYKDCSESFYSLYEKKQHLDAHIFPENTEFKCSICNMVFEKAIDRNKHVESHAIPPTFKCKQCQKDFAYFTVLVKHLEEKKCSNKNPVTCFFCETKLADYDELVRHNHLNMKQCLCGTKICGSQAYELHLSVCKIRKSFGKVQNQFEKKRLKTRKT
ncbi:hypothetical protein AMK59_7719 [Oryctes borbonicus]|uniref:C2H2-type domain-containing protein n=1 Tax=Oryctes borbonicus TaxID=1629725 RepID=A0A0T6AWQ2_9SCAR|nr:hypothetical protein AMK59_7719 [Oryctes borbonicus]